MSKIDLSKVVADVQKLYTKDKRASTVTFGDVIKTSYTEKDVIPLPSEHPFCKLSGLPGLPFNKIVQFAGRPDSGKSTAAAEIVVAAQKAGAIAIVWDTEDKLDTGRLQAMGANPSEVLLIKTNEIQIGRAHV